MNHRQAAWAVLFTALAVGSASAATTGMAPSVATRTEMLPSVATRIGDCARLPLSERGICKQQVLASAQAPLTASEKQTSAREDAAAAQARAACGRLPLSERGICIAEGRGAGSARAPMATAEQRRVLRLENDRYRARLAQCGRMPLSERTTCISDAGTPEALQGKG